MNTKTAHRGGGRGRKKLVRVREDRKKRLNLSEERGEGSSSEDGRATSSTHLEGGIVGEVKVAGSG